MSEFCLCRGTIQEFVVVRIPVNASASCVIGIEEPLHCAPIGFEWPLCAPEVKPR